MSDPEQFAPPSVPMAVARQIISGHSQRLRHWRGTWMWWSRTHWSELDDRELKSQLYKRLEHAEYVYTDPKGNEEVRSWAPTKRKLADLLDALSGVTLLSSDIDAPAWIGKGGNDGVIVSCENGLLRVADRRLLDHTPDFFNLVSVPFDYDRSAGEPKRWLKFLDELWPDDEGSVAALQEFFGYVLSGRTDLHKIVLIVGPTRSGKGTIARVLTEMIGRANMAGPTLASMSTNFGLSPLLGKPLAVISDARLGGRDSHAVVERLLTISGEDTIDVDRKYREPWTGRLPTRFLVLSNELPHFGDASGVIANRFIVLSMANSFLGRENTNLTEELNAELPGILNWSLEGLSRLAVQGRFTEPDSSSDARVTMQDMASPVSAFVRECCETGSDCEVVVDDLWAAWKEWAEDNGVRPGTKATLGSNLRSTVPGLKHFRPSKQKRQYVGLKVRTTMADPADQADQADQFPLDPLPDPLLIRQEQGSDLHDPLDPPKKSIVGPTIPDPLPDPLICTRCGQPGAVHMYGQTVHPSCDQPNRKAKEDR